MRRAALAACVIAAAVSGADVDRATNSFRRLGWGGYWSGNVKDDQHFSAGGR